MKKLKALFAGFIFVLSINALALFGLGEDPESDTTHASNAALQATEKTAEECEIPAFAKAIGHEDLWLKHNGCPPREAVKTADKTAENTQKVND